MIITTILCSNKINEFMLQIHEKLRQYERQSPIPVLHSASSLAEDVSLSHLHPCLLLHSHQSQWVSSSWEAMLVSKVNFNVLKVLNHPDVHLLKLHILLLSRSHQLSARETADLSCLLLIFSCVAVYVSVCNYSTLNCSVHYQQPIDIHRFIPGQGLWFMCDFNWQVAEELQSGPMSTEEKELLHLLTSPHLKVNSF